MTLAVSTSHQPMLSPKLRERIEESLTRHLQKPIQLDIVIATQDIVTPHKMNQHEQHERLSGAKQAAMQNPKVQKLIEMYDATVDVTIQ